MPDDDLSPSLPFKRHLSGNEPMLGTVPRRRPATLLTAFRRLLHWLAHGQQAALLRTLTDDDPTIRARAVRALRVAGDEAAVPALVTVIEDEHELLDSRMQAIRSLAWIGSAEAIPPLLRLVEHDEQQLALAAMWGLSELGALQILPLLIEAASHPNRGIRRLAVSSLGSMHHRLGIQTIVQALEDSDPIVRWSAALWAGELGDRRAIPGLVACLNDPHPMRLFRLTVQEQAKRALIRMGTAESKEALDVWEASVGRQSAQR